MQFAQTVFVMEKSKKKSIKTFFASLKKKRILTVTGCWVFYFLMSIIPIMFLLITAFSFFGVDLAQELSGRVPLEFSGAVELILGTASNVSKSVTIFFVITVVISCSTLLNQMSKDGDYIYNATHKSKRGVFRRVYAIALLLVLFLVFIAFALFFSFRNLLLFKMGEVLKNLVTAFSFVFIILFGYVTVLLLTRFISPVKLKGGALALSSFISLSIMVLGTIGLILYIRLFSSFNAFYGSLAGIIVFLLWTFVLMFALAFGAFVCMKLNAKKKKA